MTEKKALKKKVTNQAEIQAAAVSGLRLQLSEQGASLTQQRMAVFDYLSGVDHHPTAETVFLAVKQQLPKISLATVYKNLESLVACGAASKLTYGDAAARYDIRIDHHYHSRCLSCGKITDLDPPANLELAKLIKPQNGFKVEDYRIELLGRCRECKQTKEKQNGEDQIAQNTN